MINGDALECFLSSTGEFCILDEDGVMYQYKGSTNPGSKTTIFGRWTGITPFADGLPIKVKGRNGPVDSALDTFSMLFYILCLQSGFHNSITEKEYIQRIRLAMERNVITPSRDMNEFDAASRILRSYQLHGHTYDLLSRPEEFQTVINMAGNVKPNQWSAFDPRTTFPMFTLSDEEVSHYNSFLSVNGGSMLPRIETVEGLLEYMKQAGMDNSFEYNWFATKVMESQHVEYAFHHFADQLNELCTKSSSNQFSINLDGRYDKLRAIASKHGTIQEELSNAITKEVIAALL